MGHGHLFNHIQWARRSRVRGGLRQKLTSRHWGRGRYIFGDDKALGRLRVTWRLNGEVWGGPWSGRGRGRETSVGAAALFCLRRCRHLHRCVCPRVRRCEGFSHRPPWCTPRRCSVTGAKYRLCRRARLRCPGLRCSSRGRAL